MDWTMERLDERLVEYEGQLVAAGYTEGTIGTYVGDVRRFLDWLDRGIVVGPPRKRAMRPDRRATSAIPVGISSPVAVPPALRTLVADWEHRGRPPQEAMPWPRERWMNRFRDDAEFFGRLPDELDRDAVRGVTRHAVTDAASARNALLATLVWGFGWVGYGPYRADEMLTDADAGAHLLDVATILRDKDAMAAYRSLAGANRVRGLGPAFGTKYLAFCQPEGAEPAAMIHDELVTAWLEANGRPDLRATTWAPRIYETYLDQMHAWSRELGIAPETVEYLIFQEEADKRPGNQWARRR